MGLEATPPTVTMTFPVVAVGGTGTVIEVGVQPVGLAAIPLNVTVLVPILPPKFEPAIVTTVSTGPIFGVRLVIKGDGIEVTVKA